MPTEFPGLKPSDLPIPADFPIPGRADAAVVGAGVIGLCVAYELMKDGREVVVVDQGPIVGGAAAGSAGFITPSHVIPIAAPGVPRGVVRGMLRRTGPVTARPSLDPAYLGWIFRFLRSCTSRTAEAGAAALAALGFLSADLMEHLITEEGIDCCYRKDGLLHVYGDERVLAAAKHEAAEMERCGVAVEMLGHDEIREVEPALGDEVIGGFLCPNDAGLDPAMFLSSLASLLAGRGGEVRSAHQAAGVRQRLRCGGEPDHLAGQPGGRPSGGGRGRKVPRGGVAPRQPAAIQGGRDTTLRLPHRVSAPK